MHVTDLHRRSVEDFVAAVATVKDAHWDAPTPCPDWDVRALVNHVVYEDLWTVPMMEGATIAEVGDRFEGDMLGADPAAAARAAGDTATIAAASGIVAGRTVHLSFGDTPAEEYAYQLAADHIIHGWDLAAAIGADRAVDPALVEALAAWFAEREELYRGAGVIGERPAGAPVDTPLDALLVAFGRDPGWAPPSA
ncbi:MAG TPA: TIGR03086 family metal-binding protein [Acidimicrobiales bacterium]|nr:TIGR03086 family metal-binding protein [Acidimicrobiales bacterium]